MIELLTDSGERDRPWRSAGIVGNANREQPGARGLRIEANTSTAGSILRYATQAIRPGAGIGQSNGL